MPAAGHGEAAAGQPLIWLLLADKQGDNKQVFSLADNLGYRYETRFVYPKPRFVKGKPFFRPGIAHIDRSRSDPIEPPWPDVIITIGRRPTMAALWIRRRSGGRTRIILIGRQPRYLREFELVVSSCQYITADDPRIVRIALPLDDGARRAAPAAPGTGGAAGETAVLIGGPTRTFSLGVREATEMLRLAQRHTGDAPLRVVTSRRTPEPVVAWLRASLPAGARLCAWQASAHTTSDYAEALAQCARFVVTGDSVSMICDVVRAGKPLAIYRLPFRNALYDRWHRLILAVAPIDDGRVRSGWLAALTKRIVDARLVQLRRLLRLPLPARFGLGAARGLPPRLQLHAGAGPRTRHAPRAAGDRGLPARDGQPAGSPLSRSGAAISTAAQAGRCRRRPI